jgi:hypothetical protein
MTELLAVEVCCANCAAVNLQKVVLSTNCFGPTDMDTRPAEMLRSTLAQQIQSCPACGYCAPDISKRAAQCSAITQSPEYSRQLDARHFPGLANHFLCAALIAEGAADYVRATWSRLQAAWACDDAGKRHAARKCRTQAADSLLKAITLHQQLSPEPGTEFVILADVLRRARLFDKARMQIEVALAKNLDARVKRLLLFEEFLVRKKDGKRHTVAESPSPRQGIRQA